MRRRSKEIVGGEEFAVDDSLITADVSRQCGIENPGELEPNARRAVTEYFAVLDDAAFGAATPVQPKFISPVDPAARWTAASDGSAVFAYTDNYFIDLKCAPILDVEPTTAVRQAEVTAAETTIVRTTERFGVRRDPAPQPDSTASSSTPSGAKRTLHHPSSGCRATGL